MRLAMTLLLLFLVAASPAWGQSGGRDRVIELKGGERVVLSADGTMRHYDKGGSLVAMPEGVVMVAKDGGRIMMKNQALWREILELAGSSYARAIRGSGPDQRSLELEDGGRIVMGSDGAMVHYDTAGKRRTMADGEVMIAKDGRRILMGDGSLWGADGNGNAASAGAPGHNHSDK